MSDKIPETSITIHSDSYAPHGSIVTGPPDRPSKSAEAFERERRADRITHSDMLRELRWTEADYESAKQLGFPARILFTVGPRGVTNVYSRKRIAAWIDEIQAFAKRAR